MAENLAEHCRLHREESYLNITTVRKIDCVVRHKVHTSIHSMIISISSYQPDYEVNYAQWRFAGNIELTDPRLLNGAESFKLLSVEQIKLDSKHPELQKKLLG